MYIPLDNLYHWIRGIASEPVSIYTFSPHGSKNITDLCMLSREDLSAVLPEIVCHDQEPLDYTNCQSSDMFTLWLHRRKNNPEWAIYDVVVKEFSCYYQDLGFYTALRVLKPHSIFDRYILLHSEKNSEDVERLSDAAEPVYYWCHGVIARDWYRFAQHDAILSKPPTHTKTFLIYCRAWTGSREYRLKFLDLLVAQDLLPACRVSVLHQDRHHNLKTYQCADPELQPTNIDGLLKIDKNCYPAAASADYNPTDIVETDISIVLETVADDSKIHLTEKTLRPIACGHPFMLSAGPGALEYLKSYGFRTFAPWIDETYDQEVNTVQRLELITKEMHRIENLDLSQKNQMIVEIKKIADYNKQHFFSDQFANHLKDELTHNLNCAIGKIKITKGRHFRKFLRSGRKHLSNSRRDLTVLEVLKTLRKLRKDPTTSIKDIVDQFPLEFFNV